MTASDEGGPASRRDALGSRAGGAAASEAGGAADRSGSGGACSSRDATAEVEAPAKGTTPRPPEGTTELGIDIIKVDRIRRALARFGERFTRRILTDAENAYVRGRAKTLAGRWAAKEAVSKVLGLGVRGVGWREIEIVRLPTGQPTVRLHDRAARRAKQLGMARIAVSISHEQDYAVAIAYGLRTEGGAFLFPPDIEERLDDRERAILARMQRLRDQERASRAPSPPGADGEPDGDDEDDGA